MFKNATLYRAIFPTTLTAALIADALAGDTFTPAGRNEVKSVGWTPPRGIEHAPLCESINGQWIIKLMIETRTVPGDAVKQEVKTRVAAIEAETGRKPGKKEIRDIREDAYHALLPYAFSKLGASLVWINPKTGIVLVDSVNRSRTDEVLTSLVKALPGASFSLLQTTVSASSAMAEWLRSGETPMGFSAMRACELKATDDSKAVVRYANHSLDIEEVRHHIESGKLPTKLAIDWDDRVKFVLTDDFQIRSIAFEDVVFETKKGASDVDGFDTDAAIATGELEKMIGDLVEGLQGELSIGGGASQ